MLGTIYLKTKPLYHAIDYYTALKRKQIVGRCSTLEPSPSVDEAWGHYAEDIQSQKDNTEGSHLDEVPRVVKATETESRTEASRAQERGNES
jgi:hypothetical protein